ncbi:MAG: hypothetical protein BWZ06_01806 [Bacteroidetes bacterium ADurb.BinA261]|nr:MAG: hypothetical protein BWZ06_01806 [Bacteroidetes bacterium ADurb.BinA261]
MIVAFGFGISENAYRIVATGSNIETFFHDQKPFGTDKRSEVFETFAIGLRRAIDIEMIGIGRCNDRDPGMQPMKRPIVFVGFCYSNIASTGQNQIIVIIFENATQKAVAINMRLMKRMRNHARNGSFAVSACHTDGTAVFCDFAKHLCALHSDKSLLAKPGQFGM